MNVGICNEAAQFYFWEFKSNFFGTVCSFYTVYVTIISGDYLKLIFINSSQEKV